MSDRGRKAKCPDCGEFLEEVPRGVSCPSCNWKKIM